MIGSSRLAVAVTTKTRSRVDAFVSAQLQTISDRQATYAASHGGRFFQGLPTHAAPVAHTDTEDGATAAGRLTVRPTDQDEDWLALLPEWNGIGMPTRSQIDVYDGPQGKGWTWTVEATHNGQLWRRVHHVGPETARVKPWHQVTP
jgi:hypothetical protein